jgi:hypothetical protein
MALSFPFSMPRTRRIERQGAPASLMSTYCCKSMSCMVCVFVLRFVSHPELNWHTYMRPRVPSATYIHMCVCIFCAGLILEGSTNNKQQQKAIEFRQYRRWKTRITVNEVHTHTSTACVLRAIRKNQTECVQDVWGYDGVWQCELRATHTPLMCVCVLRLL